MLLPYSEADLERDLPRAIEALEKYGPRRNELTEKTARALEELTCFVAGEICDFDDEDISRTEVMGRAAMVCGGMLRLERAPQSSSAQDFLDEAVEHLNDLYRVENVLEETLRF